MGGGGEGEGVRIFGSKIFLKIVPGRGGKEKITGCNE